MENTCLPISRVAFLLLSKVATVRYPFAATHAESHKRSRVRSCVRKLFRVQDTDNIPRHDQEQEEGNLHFLRNSYRDNHFLGGEYAWPWIWHALAFLFIIHKSQSSIFYMIAIRRFDRGRRVVKSSSSKPK